VRKPEGKTSLGRPRRRRVDNIKMDLRETGWDSIFWIDLTQDKYQWGGCCEPGNEPSCSIKSWEVLE
jgi:hypothetical protein